MLGGNVCYHHGGNAPQVKAKAQRRLQQAADALVQRLLGFALDGNVADPVALQAIRDALDRAGLGAKQAVGVEVTVQPSEEVLGDVAHITKAQHEAMKRGEPYQPAKAPALPPTEDYVDAEVVPEPPETHPEHNEDRAEAARVPDWAEPPPASPTGQLVPLEDATEETAAANRAARVVRVRRRRG